MRAPGVLHVISIRDAASIAGTDGVIMGARMPPGMLVLPSEVFFFQIGFSPKNDADNKPTSTDELNQ